MTYRWILAVKFRNLVHHKPLRIAAQLWIDRQSQRLGSRAFRFRKVALLMFQIEKTFLQMKWHRIVDLTSNFVAGQICFPLIPHYGANDKLMVDVMMAVAVHICLLA